MWYHLILSDITYNQDDITLKLDEIILRRGDITLNRGDITSKARWYHILLINSKTAPHTAVSSSISLFMSTLSRLFPHALQYGWLTCILRNPGVLTGNLETWLSDWRFSYKQNRESTKAKSRVKTWQVRGIWSRQLEHKQVPQWGTEPGVKKGKLSLLACDTRCKWSMETTHNRWRSSSV